MIARTATAALAALMAVAAAPIATANLDDHETDPEEPVEVPRVVVGTADSGINPYHEFFKASPSSVDEFVLADFGIDDDHVLRISDDYEADVEAGVYDGVVPGEAYWFEGTNLIAQADGSARPFIPDGSVHGVGVTASIVHGNPEAIIYFAEGTGNIDDVFTNPNVDIVTTSFGAPTGVPVFPINASYEGVVEQGKLYFGATPNDPSLQMNDNASGPWWVVGVAGYEEGGSEGKQVLSGSTPEIVADFSQSFPYCDTCTEGMGGSSGTSFATPLTAGTISKVLLEARRATGHLGGISENGLLVDTEAYTLSNWQLRRGVEQGAYTPETVLAPGVVTTPVFSEVAFAQIGWGVVTPDPEHGVVEQTLAAIGFGEYTNTKPDGTCDFMTLQVTSRMAAWDANPTGDTFGETNALGGSPYIFC